MKRLLSLIVVAAGLAFFGLAASSCEPYETGVVIYHVDLGDFYDNMDLLASSIDVGFEEAGFSPLPVGVHYWELNGEKKACNRKAEKTFLDRCKLIDQDRSLLFLPLALKGVTIKLVYTYQGDHDLCSYTFVENDY